MATVEEILAELGITPDPAKAAVVKKWNTTLSASEGDAQTKLAAAQKKMDDAQALQRVIDENIRTAGLTETNVAQLQANNAALTAANASLVAAVEEIKKQGFTGLNIPALPALPQPAKVGSDRCSPADDHAGIHEHRADHERDEPLPARVRYAPPRRPGRTRRQREEGSAVRPRLRGADVQGEREGSRGRCRVRGRRSRRCGGGRNVRGVQGRASGHHAGTRTWPRRPVELPQYSKAFGCGWCQGNGRQVSDGKDSHGTRPREQ